VIDVPVARILGRPVATLVVVAALGRKWGLTAKAARCFAQSLSALGCFSETLKRGVSLVYRNDDGVDADTLPPRLFPDQQKQGQVFCPGFFPHHSSGTRGNRPDPAPLLVQSAASLQCCALVVTRARHHGSTEAAFGAVGTRQTGAMPGSTKRFRVIDTSRQSA